MFPRKGKELLPLVNDFGRFVRQLRDLATKEKAGFQALKKHAKVCPDLNSIENVRDLLQDRMVLTVLWHQSRCTHLGTHGNDQRKEPQQTR